MHRNYVNQLESTWTLVPEIKLIRTDTTLDLSQKAEKVCFVEIIFIYILLNFINKPMGLILNIISMI